MVIRRMDADADADADAETHIKIDFDAGGRSTDAVRTQYGRNSDAWETQFGRMGDADFLFSDAKSEVDIGRLGAKVQLCEYSNILPPI